MSDINWVPYRLMNTVQACGLVKSKVPVTYEWEALAKCACDNPKCNMRPYVVGLFRLGNGQMVDWLFSKS